MLERRAHVHLEALGNDWLRCAAVAEKIRHRLGNLDKWLTTEALARAHAHDYATAESLALMQVARLPLDAQALDLLVRLRDRYRKREQPTDADRLTATLQNASTRARLLLENVPDNPLSHGLREKLTVVLTKIESTH